MERRSAIRVVITSLIALALGAAEASLAGGPGAAKPVRAAESAAYLVDWDGGMAGRTYRSIIVIEPGQGLRRPVWVATLVFPEGTPQVAYGGTAYHSADGTLHIDCRGSPCFGPEAENWSPDSFTISPEGPVGIVDDRGTASPGGEVKGRIARGDGEGNRAWRHLLSLARYFTTGIL